MGVTRVDDLPEKRIQRSLIEARQTAREIKGSPQRVSGSNLAFFVSESAATFDWSGRLDTLAFSGLGYATLLVTLTAETAKVPLTDISVTVYTSTDGVTWTEYPYAKGMADNYNGVNPAMTRGIQVLQGREIEPKTSVFAVNLYGQFNVRTAIKVQAVGSDKLTIAVTRSA